MDDNQFLTLYCYRGSYFSSMVVMALNQLGLVYREKRVKTTDDEYSNVPLLKDGNNIILGPGNIIQYIDNKYSGDFHPSLFPKQHKKKIQSLCDKIHKCPILLLTLGVDLFPQFAENPKAPYKQAGFSKVPGQESRITDEGEIQAYNQLLKQVDEVMDEVEKQLASYSNRKKYLFCNQVTTADIYLTMMMFRLFNLGYENRYWSNGKRPMVEAYLNEFKENTAFRKACEINQPELTAAVPVIDFVHTMKDMAMPMVIMMASVAVYWLLK